MSSRGSRSTVIVIAMLAGLAGAPPVSAVQVAQSVIVSPDPADFTPNVLNGRVNAIVQVGDSVVVGGSFDQVAEPGGATLARTNLFAFDASTGAISDAFAPHPNGKVFALATDGIDVFVGGQFGRVNGRVASRVVKLDLNGQVVTSFGAQVTGSEVDDLAFAGGVLFLGGAFSAANGQGRLNLAAVDGASGAVAAGVDVPFEGLHNGGTTHVAKLDVSPDGTRLVAAGNFTRVDNQPREQIAILDLAGGSASLSSWSTQRFVPQCASRFDTYVRDIDIAPDGAYFVVATTGAFFGGSNAGVLCDTASRWELGPTGPSQQPSWVDYAGGDTTYSIAATGAAVYAGGHFRWWNNPFAGDTVGPGTVRRKGIAALDPINGLPFSWAPGRKLGEGVFSLVGTADGLWVGNDTDQIGGEYHARLAFFPTAGGETVPTDSPSVLPGELYSLPMSGCTSVDPSVLFRVNAAGPTLSSLDCGPDWSADTAASPSPDHNSGSNTASWSSVASVTASVPSTTPGAVFSSERWDPSGSPEMQWDFPVPPGRHVTVRLYFANRCSCTSHVGDRTFDVSIESTRVLNAYDIVADAGQNVGTMKSFDVTSDGTVTVAFAHVRENPLVNAVELIDRDATPVSPAAATFLRHRAFDGSTAGAPSELATAGVDWSHARGAFLSNGRIYAGWDDGKVSSRSFNGATVGPAKPIYLRGLTPAQFPVANVTGMFFENGRLFYTVTGDDRLFYRYFTVESGVIGSVTFVASGPTDGFAWGSVRGMTLASGTVYAARANGSLTSIGWSNGAPVTGSLVTVDASPAQTWASRGMFVHNG
jgi:Malectin domain